MGLIGYVNDEIRLRSKEIAIRKVNGAGRSHVLWLLLREVLWLSVPSVLAGVLAARWAGRVWMERFSDAAALSGALYALLAILLLGLVASAVVLKAWRIANENPVLSIKSE
ncbi:ABC transporter permease [Mediterranea massiliensis]|uniref:ABC transporter permease n=1 Tax=Mediterranea massiliensis TaxID=1841865 RepID=UPI0025A45FC8|nr:FtsX-like permease family protein [Mediterranea massiliensis]MDM8338170.1 FtsX-like permease family protein [Mediterranea massiliensis]